MEPLEPPIHLLVTMNHIKENCLRHGEYTYLSIRNFSHHFKLGEDIRKWLLLCYKLPEENAEGIDIT